MNNKVKALFNDIVEVSGIDHIVKGTHRKVSISAGYEVEGVAVSLRENGHITDIYFVRYNEEKNLELIKAKVYQFLGRR